MSARIEQPCGCFRAVVVRKRPVCDEEGAPKFDADGGIMLADSEDIEEGYCNEHAGVVIDLQQNVARALSSGVKTEDEMNALMAGFAPAALPSGTDE